MLTKVESMMLIRSNSSKLLFNQCFFNSTYFDYIHNKILSLIQFFNINIPLNTKILNNNRLL